MGTHTDTQLDMRSSWEEEKDRTWEFLTVVGSSQAEAQDCFAEALQLQTRGVLYTIHADSWGRLWAGCGLDVADFVLWG